MDILTDILKVLVLSVVEGITEFLPVSSTGHLILVNEFVQLQPASFANVFSVIIQLGAIFSVVVLYFQRLNPMSDANIPPHRLPRNYDKMNLQSRIYHRIKNRNRETVALWGKVLVAVVPAAILGLLFDDWIDEHLFRMPVVAGTLLFWGIVLIAVEIYNEKNHRPVRFETVEDIDVKTAFAIGLFQCLALVPGTSRSAATIIGAILLGTSRIAAADFSFFLAIPVMFGATLLKVVKNLTGFSLYQWALILLGTVLSFLVALAVIRMFLSFLKKNDFKVFGVYRIILSILIILYLILS